ncbi:MAG: stage II sporulation protein P [Eubacteriales bacterium]
MKRRRLNRKGIVVVTVCVVFLFLLAKTTITKIPWEEGWFAKQVWGNHMTVLSFVDEEGSLDNVWYDKVYTLWDTFPLQQYASTYFIRELAVEDRYTYQQILLEEARGENMVTHDGEVIIHNMPYIEEEKVEYDEPTGEFTISKEKMQQYNLEEYTTLEQLIETFYIVDAQTVVKEELLNLENLLSKEMSLQTSNDQPQILIYHTHSQEAFVDSVEGDPSTTIVAAGVELARLLSETYGYHVIHDTTEYDKENRDAAYSVAEPALIAILEEYPSIEVMIDIHRDAVAEDTQLVSMVNGEEMAKVMFFNGLSMTKDRGEITYLPNPNLAENLAFSFQMQLMCNEYYEGLTRKIYLKGYRYNLHFRGKSLLIELGAQTNTLEQILNACEPVAHALHMVLSGEEPD